MIRGVVIWALALAPATVVAQDVPRPGLVDRVVRGLRPPVAIKGKPPMRWTLAERMRALHVPGVSIAIIDSGRTELAQWALEITNAWAGRSSSLVSKTMATQMLTMQRPPFGLGLALEGTGQAFTFGHSGANRGFRSELVMFPAAGKGAVVLANADRGGAIIDEVLQSIAAEYQWPARRQSEREVVTLSPSCLRATARVER